MSDFENSLRIRPCVLSAAADPGGIRGMLFRASLAGAPASTVLALPREMRGMWVELKARGQAVQYGVVVEKTRDQSAPDSAPTLVFDQLVTIGVGSEAAGAHIAADTSVSVEIPKDAVSLVFIWGAGTADTFFEGHVSSRRGS